MKRISDQSIEEVRDRTDLVSLVEEHVSLRRVGSAYKGLCPFHDERTPSFTVNPATKTWKCFGCDEGGDAISFISQIQGEGFRWAVEYLAQRAGVELQTEDGAAPPEDRNREKRARLYEANRVASEFFIQQLKDNPESQPAHENLLKRHIDPQYASTEFGYGYAPRDGRATLKALRDKGFKDEELVEAGLANQSDRGDGIYSYFRGRAMWPIRDTFGKVIGFGARRLSDADQGPKFINTRETPIYKKSSVLFGFDKARTSIAKAHHAVVVEGYTDVVASHAAGATTAVAACGTAFTENHASILRRVVGEAGEVTFGLDDDAAGQKATLEVYNIMKGSIARLTALPDSGGLDPDEFRHAHGDEALRDLFERRIPLLQKAIDNTLAKYPQRTPEDRVVALRAVTPLIGQAPDPILRNEYARRVADALQVDVREVVARASDSYATTQSTGGAAPGAEPTTPAGPPPPGARRRALDPEYEALLLMVLHRDVAEQMRERARTGLRNPHVPALIAAIDAALDNPAPRAWPLVVHTRAEHEATKRIIDQMMFEPTRPGDPLERCQHMLRLAHERQTRVRRDHLTEVLRSSTDADERARAFEELQRLRDQDA